MSTYASVLDRLRTSVKTCKIDVARGDNEHTTPEDVSRSGTQL